MNIKFEYPFKTKEILEIKDNFSAYSHIKSNLLFSDCNIKEPEISIVIPTYKNPETIFQAIESAINQIGAPLYEIVIVNNNPEEGNDFIERLKEFHSNKINYYQNTENIGLFGNWNRCIELARAEEIVYLHSDDMLCKDTLKKLWELHLKVEKDAAILGYPHVIDQQGKLIKQYKASSKLWGILKSHPYYKMDRWSLFHADMDCGCGEMFNKQVLKQIGGWNPDLYPAGDVGVCLLYQIYSKVYRLNTAIRVARIGYNTSLTTGKLYPSCSFYIRNRIVEKFFNKNKFLKYLIYLNSISMNIDWCGVSPKRNLKWYENILCKLENKFYTLHRFYL